MITATPMWANTKRSTLVNPPLCAPCDVSVHPLISVAPIKQEQFGVSMIGASFSGPTIDYIVYKSTTNTAWKTTDDQLHGG